MCGQVLTSALRHSCVAPASILPLHKRLQFGTWLCLVTALLHEIMTEKKLISDQLPAMQLLMKRVLEF